MMHQRIKKNILLLIPILLLWSACKKYDEGPLISFRSAEKRLGVFYNSIAVIINGENYEEKDQFAGFAFDHITKEVSISSYISTFFDTIRQSNIWLKGGYLLNKDKLIFTFDSLSCYSEFAPEYFGPFAQMTRSDWDVKRLSYNDLVIECTFDQDNYRIYLMRNFSYE